MNYIACFALNPMSKLCLNIYKATILKSCSCDVYVNLVLNKETCILGRIGLNFGDLGSS